MFDSPFSDLGDDLAYPTVYMAGRLREMGHTVNTLDMATIKSFDAAVFFDHPTFLDWRFIRLLIRRVPLFLFANENPMHRPDNYWRFNLWPFKRVFSWRTLWPKKPDNVVEFRLPVKIPENFSIDRTRRKLLCAVFSNKSSNCGNELYSARLEAIRYFAGKCEIDLYGHGWDRLHLDGCWKGAVDRKSDVMRDYKFALAYENAQFPGYITEKIFDAMFAGCIPVYFGAQDIENFIPPETFIEARRFSTLHDLRNYLIGMSPAEERQRLNAIEQFVRGEEIKRFGPEAFTQLILKHVAVSASVCPACNGAKSVWRWVDSSDEDGRTMAIVKCPKCSQA